MDSNSNASAAPSAEPQVRRLYRRPDRKMIGGVAAGLGDYFGVDPLLFRVGFVALTVAGGAGVLLYLFMWWIVPPIGEVEPGQSAADRALARLRESPAWVGVALVALGAVALARGLFGTGITEIGVWGPAAWGVALVVAGVLLFRHAQDRNASVTQAPPQPVGMPSPSGPMAPGSAAPGPPYPPPGPPLPPPGMARVSAGSSWRPRERSALGWITLGAALVAVGVAAVLDRAGAIHVDAGHFVALVLAVIGAGLVVGAWLGRARWLIVIGVLLLPVVLVLGLIDVPITGGVGNQLFRPVSAQGIHPTYRLMAGTLTLDLSDVRFELQPVHVTASVAAGQLQVFVPADVNLEVHVTAGAGEVNVLGRRFDGLRVRVDRTFLAPTAIGTLVLDVGSGLGQVAVYRTGPAAPQEVPR